MNQYKLEIKWGFVFIAMTLTWMLLERLVGLHSTHIDKHPIYTNFILLPALAIYVLALRDKRDHFYKGNITFTEGFITGMFITLVVTFLTPLSQVIIIKIITPHFFSNVIEYAVANNKMSLEEANAYFSLRNYISQSLLGAPIMGSITSGLVAFFMRSKDKSKLAT